MSEWIDSLTGITEEEREKIRKAEAINIEVREETHRILSEFRRMCMEGVDVDERYGWLDEQHRKQEENFLNKYGYPLNNGFAYLYPETIIPFTMTDCEKIIF